VLDVIVTGREEEDTSNISMPSRMSSVQASAQCHPNAVSKDLASQENCGSVDITSVVQHVSSLSIAAVDAVDRSLILQSAILDNEEHAFLEGSSFPMQNIQIPTVDDYINERLGRIKMAGIQEGDLFQVHTLHLLQQMLDKQQQTLNRQVLLENRVQALMTQIYELHEYPIPRLFIVLPKPKRRKDKITHPLTKRFRLYFLCECGEHTTGVGRGNLPNRIHLAKHEGYDLDQPNEFFERYGSYVLAMLKFLKYSTMAAGVVVPPLTLFKVFDGLDAVQKRLAMSTDTIGSLVDQTIQHIQDLQGTSKKDGGKATEHMRLEDVEALEGADLRQLQLYLNDKDKGRVLGDLFRVFTHEGHVKWVCIDHYKENYRKAALQRLKDVISVNNGGFNQTDSSVRIELKSNTEATQFYEALVKAYHSDVGCYSWRSSKARISCCQGEHYSTCAERMLFQGTSAG
jgi:hypothetical protein